MLKFYAEIGRPIDPRNPDLPGPEFDPEHSDPNAPHDPPVGEPHDPNTEPQGEPPGPSQQPGPSR